MADPFDLDAFAVALRDLLGDPKRAERLAVEGHQRVLEEYLGDRHLAQYVELLAALIG